MLAYTTERVKMPADSHVISTELSLFLFNISIRDRTGLSIVIDINIFVIAGVADQFG